MLHRRYPNLWAGCVGAWCPSLDNSRSTLLMDKSGFGNHGTLTNMDPGTDWVASDGRVALDFDASNDNVDLGIHSRLMGISRLSISLWRRANTITYADDAPTFISQATTNYILLSARYAAGGKIYFAVNNGPSIFSLYTDTVMSALKWHHIAVSLNGPGGATIYLDGMPQATTVNNPWSAVTTGSDASSLLIGAASTKSLDGQLDDLRFYDRAITASEVSLLATRRGIAYEMQRHRVAKTTSAVAARNRNYAWSPF